MRLARVVSFDGVGQDRLDQLKQQVDGGLLGEIPATEIVMLHDAATERSVVLLFFENEADYDLADATLSAMPAEETPGRRTSVDRFEVAARATS